MEKLLNIKQVSEMLDVGQSTLRKWDKNGVLKSIRTAGGHRRYNPKDIEKIQSGTKGCLIGSSSLELDFPCKKKCEDATNLTKKNHFDAGLDIKSNEEYIIESQSSCLVSTGLYLQIPNGFVGLIWSRSGLSVKHRVEVGAGCIDSNYRGEVKVHLYNLSNEKFTVKKGDKIAQLLTLPVCLNEYIVVNELDETERNQNGFGSTGVK